MKFKIKQVTEVGMSNTQQLILNRLKLDGYKMFVLHLVVNRCEEWGEMYALDELQVYSRVRAEVLASHNFNRYDRRK